jgi:DNA polymerase-3 subunit alpha
VAYQTAYLKAHYPSEYMAAVLNHAGSIEKITFFMEECKRMGLKVLGPDINESKKGFAVNKKGEIRFGLGGLKGVGEAAIEAIIEEREKGGHYKNVFEFISRVNQRTVNKKSIESLVYSGAFDCFNDIDRAQYFYTPKGESINGLEKIIRYGNSLQQKSQQTTNTLFGDLADSVDVQLPKLATCPPWTLTEKLNFEKEVTGMFMSGHPLDHFRFELRHYGITPIRDFLEMANNEEGTPPPAHPIRLAGLVVQAQQRTTRTGKNFVVLHLEDYSGKTEITFWSNEMAKFSGFFQNGLNHIQLLETIRQQNTKMLELHIDPAALDAEAVAQLEKNLKRQGATQLKVMMKDNLRRYEVEMVSQRSVEINEEMAEFLLNTPAVEVKVVMNE